MSAIFGIIRIPDLIIQDQEALAIKTELQHRAVDGAYMYHHKNILIGNQELCVSVFQKQDTISYEKDSYIITADVRLDNRAQLIHSLSSYHNLSKEPDAALIVKAFKKWGNNCVHFLEGEFAFCIWDAVNQSFFAASDHIGFRTFHYYISDTQFIFASEIKGLLAVKPKPNYFNEDYLVDAITSTNGESTYNKEIFTLKTAHQLSFTVNENKPLQITLSQYWKLQKRGQYQFTNNQDWADCLRELLKTSVKNRLNTNKPVGIALSGGLDSSFLAAILASELKSQNKTLFAFSNVLPNSNKNIIDEREYLQLLTKKYDNIELELVKIDENINPLTDWDQTFRMIETLPYPLIFVDKILNERAQQKQVGTFFSGFGGDFTISNSGETLIAELLIENNILKSFNNFLNKRNEYGLGFRFFLNYYIQEHTTLLNSFYKQSKRLIKKDEAIKLNNFLQKKIRWTNRFGYNSFNDQYGFINSVNTSCLFAKLFHTKIKFNGQFNQESSIPILDKAIIEFFIDVPGEQFIQNGFNRSLIRRAMDGLVPKEIQWRKTKNPFVHDLYDRVILQKEQILYVLNNINNEYIESVIDKNAILTDLNLICNCNEPNEALLTKCRFTIWAVFTILFIKSVEKSQN